MKHYFVLIVFNVQESEQIFEIISYTKKKITNSTRFNA